MKRLLFFPSVPPSAGLLLATLLILLGACASTPDGQAPPEKPAEKADGQGFRFWKPSKPPEAVAPEWASRTLEATEAAPMAKEAGSHVEALMVARRQACDQALRQLASQVLALPNPAGGTVGELLQDDKDLRTRVERALRVGCVYTPVSTQAVREYRVTARLPLRPVAAEIWDLPEEEEEEEAPEDGK